MILRTVHFPRAYEAREGPQQFVELYCAQVLQILHDADRNCVILLDSDHEILAGLSQAIQSYPPRYAQEAAKLLKRLMQNNRLIMLETTSKVDSEGTCSWPA